MPVVSGNNEITRDGLRSSTKTKGDKRMESTDSATTRVSAILGIYVKLRHLASEAYKVGMFIAYCKSIWDNLSPFLDF